MVGHATLVTVGNVKLHILLQNQGQVPFARATFVWPFLQSLETIFRNYSILDSDHILLPSTKVFFYTTLPEWYSIITTTKNIRLFDIRATAEHFSGNFAVGHVQQKWEV